MFTFKMIDNFFDRDHVVRAMDKATHQALSKAGAFIMRRARTSMRYRNRTSRPGEPPTTHRSTGYLRRFLWFAWDRGSASVVVGPAATNQRTGAPTTLEFGGTVDINVPTRNFRGGGRRFKRQRVTMAARPYMQPALDAEIPNIPLLFQGAVRSEV